jgi:hypothetical protein
VYYKNDVVLRGDRKCQSILLTKWTPKYHEQYFFCAKFCQDTQNKIGAMTFMKPFFILKNHQNLGFWIRFTIFV